MPGSKVYLGRIKDSSLLKEADMPRNNGTMPLRVNFDDGQSALLDVNHPRAAVWAKMISRLQRNNQPATPPVQASRLNPNK